MTTHIFGAKPGDAYGVHRVEIVEPWPGYFQVEVNDYLVHEAYAKRDAIAFMRHLQIALDWEEKQ